MSAYAYQEGRFVSSGQYGINWTTIEAAIDKCSDLQTSGFGIEPIPYL